MAELESNAMETDVPTSTTTHKNGTSDDMPSEQLSSELVETVKDSEPDSEGVVVTTKATTAEEIKKEEMAPKTSSDATKKEQSTPTKALDNTKKQESPQDADKKPYKREQMSYSRGKISKYNKIWKDNIKSEMTSQPESSDPAEIRKQVTFAMSW